MKQSDLIPGKRYKIKYRRFNANGDPIAWDELTAGEGVLLAIQDVSYYNHRFVLDDGTQVWVTSNSIKEIPNPLVELAELQTGMTPAELVGIAESSARFLEGLGIESFVDGVDVVIPARGLSKMKTLLNNLYAKALLDD